MREIILRGRGPNTLSLGSLDAFERELEGAGDEPLLIRGEGSAFSAGLDLDDLAKADVDHVARLLEAIERTAQKIFTHPAPTAAYVNGHAVAGGCLLVQCCDVRVAADDPKIRIGMTGVAIGLVYPPLVLAVFRHRVPMPHLETVLLGAKRHSPQEALALGLVDEVSADAEARARAHLEARAALPRASYASTKRSLRQPAVDAASAGAAAFREEAIPAWTSTLLRR